ncbi:bifunctional lytic transglycosylase/C40 family peptidase [Streptomyces sp. SRF1]|uniref:C40 family peptidase n=1 Tax=Streptomyces sp. SRF1 TaxID=1549642 RepID=UPI0025AFDDF8|nr:bifunctional lytic transglycosylase/C40 family peptidase [Streptomyces sp. SRF1]MDN3059396.1 bifunctional lytic transglycosylase/C40 family peptidase [Streptomyces sp. SRF1]
MKRKMGCLGVLFFALVCCAGPLTISMSASSGSGPAAANAAAAADIPARVLTAYIAAAEGVRSHRPRCRGMQWQVLAGIAKVESGHAAGHTVSSDGDIRPRILGPRLDGSGAGGNTTPMPDTDHGRWDGDPGGERAVGPFQFLPSTFRTVGRDGNDDGATDPHNIDDAALSAAVYLCGRGRDLTQRQQLETAIRSYNHSAAYVADVMEWIARYKTTSSTASVKGVTGKARTVLAAALSQRGMPYSWGGGSANGPSYGICCSPGGSSGEHIRGFDCSGLTSYAYAQAGITLPRTAAAQAGVGRRIPASAGVKALQPGDLVFYGYVPTADGTIHHVGIYLGNGKMINALRPGTKVRVDPVSVMSDYAGGARPW